MLKRRVGTYRVFSQNSSVPRDRGNQSTFNKYTSSRVRSHALRLGFVTQVPRAKITARRNATLHARYKGPPFIGPRKPEIRNCRDDGDSQRARILRARVCTYIMGRPQIPGGSWKIRVNRSFRAFQQLTSAAKRRANNNLSLPSSKQICT